MKSRQPPIVLDASVLRQRCRDREGGDVGHGVGTEVDEQRRSSHLRSRGHRHRHQQIAHLADGRPPQQATGVLLAVGRKIAQGHRHRSQHGHEQGPRQGIRKDHDEAVCRDQCPDLRDRGDERGRSDARSLSCIRHPIVSGNSPGFEHQGGDDRQGSGGYRCRRGVGKPLRQIGIPGGAAHSVEHGDPTEKNDPEQRTQQICLHRGFGAGRTARHPNQAIKRNAREQEARCEHQHVLRASEHQDARRRKQHEGVGLALTRGRGHLVRGEPQNQQCSQSDQHTGHRR